MPKVIKHGDRWPQHRENWVGKRLTCASCGCIFEIDESDHFRRSRIPGLLTRISQLPSLKPGNEFNIEINCPECSHTTSVNWSE